MFEKIETADVPLIFFSTANSLVTGKKGFILGQYCAYLPSKILFHILSVSTPQLDAYFNVGLQSGSYHWTFFSDIVLKVHDPTQKETHTRASEVLANHFPKVTYWLNH